MFKLDASLSNILDALKSFWTARGVVIVEETEIRPAGAATFSLHTINFMQRYVQDIAFIYPCYRPHDNASSLHLPQYLQFQVLLRLDEDILPDVMQSIAALSSTDISKNIVTYGDHWSAPTMGAFGDGWEIQLNGIEVTQVTYFTHFLGTKLDGYQYVEVTYGVERLAMMIANGNSLAKTQLFGKLKEESMSNKELLLQLHKHLERQMSYTDFIHANLLFNILDSRHEFTDEVKNLYMYKIKSMFENYS